MIDPSRVEAIFRECLFRDEEVVNGEPVLDPIRVEGIMLQVGLHPERVESYRAEVAGMLAQLPEPFQDGWSFLNGCMTQDQGDIWTGEQRIVDLLFILGMSIDRVKLLFPRDMWGVLPGGVPYYMVTPA